MRKRKLRQSPELASLTFTGNFACGKEFDGNRWNACHYTVAAKRAARDAAKGAKDD